MWWIPFPGRLPLQAVFSYDFLNKHLSVAGLDAAWSVSDLEGTDVASPGVAIVPEPATLALLAMGGLLYARKK